MKFIKFVIKNYKGIENITIDLTPSGAGIFSLIGLNESGKTSILEAISSFNPHLQDNDEEALYSNHEAKKFDPNKLIPKHKKSNFSEDIRIEATLELNDDDKERIIRSMENFQDGNYEIKNLSDTILIIQERKYEDSIYSTLVNRVGYNYDYKSKRVRKWTANQQLFGNTKELSNEIGNFIYNEIKKIIPKIAYYPTFIFNQPENIKITDNEDEPIHKIYTKAIENLAKSTNATLDIQKHIIDRALGSKDNEEALQATLDQMSGHLTETIFQQWTKILTGDFSNREIILKHEVKNEDVYIRFILKQGSDRYNFSERSLGFRWFFSFLLFTLYGSKYSEKNTLFILDEPASYLHAQAQQALLESFPKITEDGSQIIYSTHSHYLINPHWLDQAYIISNNAINSYGFDDKNFKPENTIISAIKYRKYVNDNPTKTTYFQPILDRLNITSSKLDLVRPSILTEGKSDYLILEYGIKVLLGKDDMSIIPMSGAHGFNGVIGLLKGWGIPFIACFDADKAGIRAKKNLIEQYFLNEERVLTLEDILPNSMKGCEISSLLSEEDKKMIKEYIGEEGKDEKSKIQLFFSEALAQNSNSFPFSEIFKKNIEAIYDCFYEKLNKQA
ncbi:TPA: AAA family ATPase [Neisseria subflava]